MEYIREKISLFTQSEIYSVILTIYVIGLGVVGGRLADDFPHSWPWNGVDLALYSSFEQGYFADGVGLYYLSVLLFGVLFFIREKSKLKAERNLLATIRTMPPAKIMSIFEKSYKELKKYVDDNAYDPNASIDLDERIDNTDNAIRLGLDVINALAANFQRVDSARYAANLMLYLSVDDMDEPTQEEALRLMQSYLHTLTIDGLRGALFLIPEYSASTDDPKNSFEPDPHLKRFALPIPIEAYEARSRRKRYLPGAPTALIEETPSIIDDTHQLYDEYKQLREYDVLPSVFQTIDKYFRESEEGAKIRSFMSVPLKYRHPGGIEDTLGVINIHSDERGLFASDALANNYYCLCQPIFEIIAELVILRYDLQSLFDGSSTDEAVGDIV